MFKKIICLLVLSLPASAQTLLMDAETIDYLQELALPIEKTLELEDKHIPYYLIQRNEINAFVNQKNELYMFTGLIEKAETPSEVLGVLAHELGHISGKHIFKTIHSRKDFNLPVAAGMLLGIGALAAGSADAGIAVISGTHAGIQTAALSYNRAFEQQADQIALEALHKSNMPMQGFTDFMQKLSKDQALYSRDMPQYLLTHPYSSSRTEFAKSFIQENTNTAPLQLNQDRFEFIQAKIKAYRLKKEAVVYFFPPKNKAQRYGLAIGYAFAAEKEKALNIVNDLLSTDANNPYLYELKALILEDHGHLQQALTAFEKAHHLKPENQLLRLQYAESLVQNEKYMQAIPQLLRLRQEQQRWSHVPHLLGIAYGKMGDLGNSHLYLAEESLLKGDRKNYAFHIQMAKDKVTEQTPAWHRLKLLQESADASKKSK